MAREQGHPPRRPPRGRDGHRIAGRARPARAVAGATRRTGTAGRTGRPSRSRAPDADRIAPADSLPIAVPDGTGPTLLAARTAQRPAAVGARPGAVPA
jgi:hypothetical protein